MKKLFFYSVLALLPFAVMEAFFRLLPVSDPPYLLPVSAEQPIVRYQPDVEYRYAEGWDFWASTQKRTNNFGYDNVIDYRPDEASPLLVVIGDSFVEAQIVPAGQNAAEILHSRLAGAGRVYSLGISGAPLSQYLAFAEFAHRTFHPGALAFFVNDSDFDESLLKYKSEPRFHYFAEGADGLELRRVDYERSLLKTWLRESALVRYVVFHLQPALLLEKRRRAACHADDPHLCISGSPAALEERIADAQRAVEHFLDELPARSGLGTDAVAFVLDAPRPALYSPEALEKAEGGYYGRMRAYFMARARARGYEVIDLQPAFLRRHRRDGARFEFQRDYHWNALGHRLVADELAKSRLVTRIFGGPVREVARTR